MSEQNGTRETTAGDVLTWLLAAGVESLIGRVRDGGPEVADALTKALGSRTAPPSPQPALPAPEKPAAVRRPRAMLGEPIAPPEPPAAEPPRPAVVAAPPARVAPPAPEAPTSTESKGRALAAALDGGTTRHVSLPERVEVRRQRRTEAAILLAQSGPMRSALLSQKIRVPYGTISSLMNCPWFHLTDEGWTVTAEGKREAGVKEAA